jgi:hypothetical protein
MSRKLATNTATEHLHKMSDKLNIANEMKQFDLKNRDFYDELTPEERKKFSNFLMIRWGSSVQGSQELQEYYVQSCNHYFNKNFFAISKHPNYNGYVLQQLVLVWEYIDINGLVPRRKKLVQVLCENSWLNCFPI